MQESINQLQRQINELQRQVNLLKSVGDFPYDVEQSISGRLGIDDIRADILEITPLPSVKTPASETQAVDEGGTGTYDVAKPMDGFEQREVAGQTRYYPYYT